MGYILPITPYQSMNYCNREDLLKRTNYSFQSVSKVVLDCDQKSRTFDNLHLRKKYKSALKKSHINEKLVQSTLAEMTGKGQFINESI